MQECVSSFAQLRTETSRVQRLALVCGRVASTAATSAFGLCGSACVDGWTEQPPENGLVGHVHNIFNVQE